MSNITLLNYFQGIARDKSLPGGIVDATDFSQIGGISGLYHHQQCQPSPPPSTVNSLILLLFFKKNCCLRFRKCTGPSQGRVRSRRRASGVVTRHRAVPAHRVRCPMTTSSIIIKLLNSNSTSRSCLWWVINAGWFVVCGGFGQIWQECGVFVNCFVPLETVIVKLAKSAFRLAPAIGFAPLSAEKMTIVFLCANLGRGKSYTFIVQNHAFVSLSTNILMCVGKHPIGISVVKGDRLF